MTTPTPQDPNAAYGAPQGQQAPQAAYGQQQYAAPAGTGKSYVAAILLSFFFGGIGAADFFMGYKKYGFIKLGILIGGYILMFAGGAMNTDYEPNVLGLIIGGIGSIALFVLGIWSLATFICIIARKWIYAADSNGVPLV